MINVFFPYYSCGDAIRQAEIDLCLHKNIENQHISRLVVLIDDDTKFESLDSKVTVLYLKQRPTYRLWLELTKELQLEGVSLLANSDIYFDDTVVEVLGIINSDRKFLALSRWELINSEISLHKNPHWSQDVWGIHCSADISNELLVSLAFPMGVPRCDNKIAYLFATRGFAVFNPCHVLRSIHVHKTELRTYHKKLDERILGGVAYVFPGDKATDEATLDFDVWVKRSAAIKKVALNKSLEKWLAEAEQLKVDKADLEQSKSGVTPLPMLGHASANEVKSNDTPDKILACFEQASPAEFVTALKQNDVVFDAGVNFKLLGSDGSIYFNNIYRPTVKLKTTKSNYESNKQYCHIVGLIPAVLDTYSNSIGIKPKDKGDINFWQYPCATEKQAFENHLEMPLGSNVDRQQNIVNIYIPLPWATYIDKKQFPETFITRISQLIGFYREIATQNGYNFAAHTVCQHIHWVRILNKCTEIGITNLHLSHKDSKSEAAQKSVGTSLTLHGWPLIAVNYEIPERSIGMKRKPVAERKLLASFIGAHMKHYRDDSRIRLFEAAKASGRADVLVDLGTEWHFNKIVYEEQVLNKAVSAEHLDEHQQKTMRYNSILSDSKFSLCPEGAGPNTLRFWESIAVGAVPVIFSKDLSFFNEHNIGRKIIESLVIWDSQIDRNLFDYLSNINFLDIERKSDILKGYYNAMVNDNALRCY